MDLVSSPSRSQLNGVSTSTNGAEAPQATKDSNSNDTKRPSTYVDTLLPPATAAEVEAIFEPATPAQLATMGLDRLTLDSRLPNSKGTDAP